MFIIRFMYSDYMKAYYSAKAEYQRVKMKNLKDKHDESVKNRAIANNLIKLYETY